MMSAVPLSPRISSQLNFPDTSSRQALLGQHVVMSQLSRSYSHALDQENLPSFPNVKGDEVNNCRSFLSSSSSNTMICRICHDGESREELVQPCRCAGTMATIHVSCIEKWLSSINSDKCEICGYKYITKSTARPCKEWLTSVSGQRDRRNLVGDLICFGLLTPLAGVSAWLCITGASHYAHFASAKWETIGLVTLTAFLILIYVIWCGVAIKYHTQVFSRWRKNNPIIKIVNRPVSPSSRDIDENNNVSVVSANSDLQNDSVFTEAPGYPVDFTASLPALSRDAGSSAASSLHSHTGAASPQSSHPADVDSPRSTHHVILPSTEVVYVSVRGSVSAPGMSGCSLPRPTCSDSSLSECKECLLPPSRRPSGEVHYVRSTPVADKCVYKETFV